MFSGDKRFVRKNRKKILEVRTAPIFPILQNVHEYLITVTADFSDPSAHGRLLFMITWSVFQKFLIRVQRALDDILG